MSVEEKQRQLLSDRERQRQFELMIQVFWDVIPCLKVNSYRHLKEA